MPKTVDHEGRRTRLAEALWRIAYRDGLDAVTVRQVAAEAEVSVGLVQHYFRSKDELLRFALERVGSELQGRLVNKITELGADPDPYDVIWTVMLERLPLTSRRRAQTQVMVAWLGRVARQDEPNDYLANGTAQSRDYLAGQLRRGQDTGRVEPDLDPDAAASALLALTEGLAAQLIAGIHTAASAESVLRSYLDLLFRGESHRGDAGPRRDR